MRIKYLAPDVCKHQGSENRMSTDVRASSSYINAVKTSLLLSLAFCCEQCNAATHSLLLPFLFLPEVF